MWFLLPPNTCPCTSISTLRVNLPALMKKVCKEHLYTEYLAFSMRIHMSLDLIDLDCTKFAKDIHLTFPWVKCRKHCHFFSTARVITKIGHRNYVDMHYTVQVDKLGEKSSIPCSSANDHNMDKCVYNKGINHTFIQFTFTFFSIHRFQCSKPAHK